MNLEPKSGRPSLNESGIGERHNIAYYVQYRFHEWVDLDANGKVVAAGPLLRAFVGRNIHDIRRAKMVTKVERAPEPEKPKVILA